MTSHEPTESELLQCLKSLVEMLTKPGELQMAVMSDAELAPEIQALSRSAMSAAVQIVTTLPSEAERVDIESLYGELTSALASINNKTHQYAVKKLAALGTVLTKLPIEKWADCSSGGEQEALDAIEAAKKAADSKGVRLPEGARFGAIRLCEDLSQLMHTAEQAAGSEAAMADIQVKTLDTIPEEFRDTDMAIIMNIVGTYSAATYAQLTAKETIRTTVSSFLRVAAFMRDLGFTPTLYSKSSGLETVNCLINAFAESLVDDVKGELGKQQPDEQPAVATPFVHSHTVH